jgi:hypothetical protein
MGQRPAALLILLAILLAELVALYPGVFFRGEVLSSSALAYGMPPWKGHIPPTRLPLRGNPVLSDDMALFTPWDSAIRADLAAGHAPLWNPGSGCGMPLLANNQSAVLAPTQFLRFIWDSPRARTVGVLLKVLVAGAGLFLLLTRWRIPPIAALLGALAWSNAAGVTVWLLYPLAETAAWFPWLLLGLSQLLGVGGSPTRLGAVTTALAAAAMLLAGHLPTAVQLLVAAGGGVLLLAVLRPDVRRRLPGAGAAVVVAILLAAPQVLPTAAYALTSRARETRGAAVPAAAQRLPLRAAWSWLVPRGFGSPERDGYEGPLNFNEATASVGIAPLFLACLLPFLGTGRLGRTFCALVALASAAAYGLPPFAWIEGHVPVLRWTAGQRWVLLAQFGVAVLAALSAARLRAPLPSRRLRIATTGVGLVLLLLILLHPALAPGAHGGRSVLAAQGVLLATGELAVAAVALAAASFGLPRVALPILILGTTASGLLFAWGFNPTIPPSAIPGATPETRSLDAARGEGRVFPVGWVMRPNTGLLAGLPTVTGIDDLVPGRYAEFARWAEFGALDAARPLEIRSSALLRRAAVTVVVADRPIEGTGLTPLADLQGPLLWAATLEGAHPAAAWYPTALPVADTEQAFAILARTRVVDENTVLVERPITPLPSAPGLVRPLTLRRSGPNRVVVECSQPRAGVVVVRELADPGWRATIDRVGTSPLVVDGMFLGALVGPGSHVVEFTYRPAELTVAVVLAGLGVIALLAMCAVGLRRGGTAHVSLGGETPSKDRSRR